MITPADFEEFQKLASQHDLVPICRQLLADSLTPVSAFKRLDDGQTACLFESVIGGEKVGRYSFLAFRPYQTISATRDRVTISSDGQDSDSVSENPFEDFRRLIEQVSIAEIDDMPPFAGGGFGGAGGSGVSAVGCG